MLFIPTNFGELIFGLMITLVGMFKEGNKSTRRYKIRALQILMVIKVLNKLSFKRSYGFHTTVKVKTINGEVQLQALVDGKKIIVTKAFVRRDLQLNDEEGTDYLPNTTIFEELTRMGTTAWNEFSSTMASVIIYLATNQKFNFLKYIFESMVKNLDNAGKFLMVKTSAKGLVIYEEEQATTPTVSSQQPSQAKIQDKETWDDDIHAKIEAGQLLAERLQAREQEELTIEERATFIKKQKVDEDKDTIKFKSLQEVIPDEEEVEVDAIPLATKPPSIVDWKIHKEGNKSYYQIFKANGSSKMYLVFSHMLKSFNKEHLENLYKLVTTKYGSTRPVEDLDLVLYGDLKIMFDPHVEDQVWKNQSDYRVLEWKLYDSCGVHSLRKQNYAHSYPSIH
ncbi:hypothetical protein Tco_0340120 [Tanacetum coccineum]